MRVETKVKSKTAYLSHKKFSVGKIIKNLFWIGKIHPSLEVQFFHSPSIDRLYICGLSSLWLKATDFARSQSLFVFIFIDSMPGGWSGEKVKLSLLLWCKENLLEVLKRSHSWTDVPFFSEVFTSSLCITCLNSPRDVAREKQCPGDELKCVEFMRL